MKNNKILAIDFGENKVGLAFVDKANGIVFGKGQIANFKSLTSLFEKIKMLVLDLGINEIIFGLPLSGSGVDTPQSLKIRHIAKKLQDYLGMGLFFSFIDESFSSFEARNLLNQSGKDSMEFKRHEDETAAIWILKKYLGDL